jgi:cytochrome bd ubiquinol oxidase subunit I
VAAARRGWRAEALPRPLLWGWALMTFSGWVATVAGWYVTEIGRQPWIVHGLLRTDEVASSVPVAAHRVHAGAVPHVYLALLVAYVSVVKHMAEKPVPLPEPPAPKPGANPAAKPGGGCA